MRRAVGLATWRPMGIIGYMPYVVKLRCKGTTQRPHAPHTLAQFKHDDGWARVHNRGNRDVLVQESDGELVMYHLIACDHPSCIRAKPRYVPGGRLYPTLDYARDHDDSEITLR
jgi:hypothetical protein